MGAKKRIRPKDKERSYNKDYYARNKSKITKKKNRRYKEDAGYRERALRESAAKYRASRNVEIPGELREGSRTVCVVGGEDWYSISEVAKIIGAAPGTIARWIDTGVIPEPFREATGRRWRWFSARQVDLLKALRGSRINMVGKSVIENIRGSWGEN